MEDSGVTILFHRWVGNLSLAYLSLGFAFEWAIGVRCHGE